MNLDSLTNWYDEFVNAHPEGITTKAARAYLAERVEAVIAREPRDLKQEAANIVAPHIAKLRENRTKNARNNITEIIRILQAKEFDTDAYWEVCSFALATGDPRGIDKALKFWTAEDFNTWIVARKQNRDATNAAYLQDVEMIDEITALIYTHDAHTLSELAIRQVNAA